MSTFKFRQNFLLQIVMISMIIILANDSIHVLSQSAHNDFAAVAISPDGTKIVGGGSNGLLRLWDVSTGQVLQDYSGVTQSIAYIAWSPDGSRIVSGGSDTTIRVWDLNGILLSSMDSHNIAITSVSWSSDGAYLASAGFTGLDEYSLRIWDGTTYSLLYQYSAGSINSLAWHPIRHEIALAGQNGFIYTVTVSAAGIEFTGLSYENPTAMMSVAWNSDGTKIATGDAMGNISILEPTTFNNLASLTGHTSYVEALVWSPDNARLASASADGTVRTWDVASGENIDVFQNPKITITTSIDWYGDLLTFGQADAQIETIVFPTAAAGIDQMLTDVDANGSEVVTLDGSASSDTDGTIVSYEWTENGISIATGVNPQVNLAVGVHEIILTVTDDDGATGSDTVVITVESPSIVCNTTISDTPALLSAITSANTTPKPDTICLETGTYTLTTSNNSASDGPNGLPVITSDITLHGLGAGATIFRDSAAPDFRILKVDTGARLVLDNITVSGGDAGSGSGGGIRNLGTLELRSSVVENNLPDDLSGEGAIIQTER